jgi:thymidylate synthase ThyX
MDDEFERFVQPSVYFVGFTQVDENEVSRYLIDTGNQQFLESVDLALKQGLSWAEILCSMFAKLCYKSLTLGKNSNVSRTRDIWDNLVGCFDTAHGSIFEHVQFNFLIRDCSRVFTHELVRHRIGTAFSQTSGRYCRIENMQLVWDPILNPVRDLFETCAAQIEKTVYLAECRLGLRKPPGGLSKHLFAEDLTFGNYNAVRNAGLLIEKSYRDHVPDVIKALLSTPKDAAGDWSGEVVAELAHHLKWEPDNSFNFDIRKKMTSAIRRIAPNGQSNEIAFSCNLRTLRHTVLMRTAKFAEWEIRFVFAKIFEMVKAKYPLAFYGAKTRMIEGIPEVYGMRMQPYELSAQMALDEMSDEELTRYLKTRPRSTTQAV